MGYFHIGNYRDELRALQNADEIPAALRAHLCREPDPLLPGDIEVLQDFCGYLRAHQMSLTCPPRAAFDATASSEAELIYLLAVLKRHIPVIDLAEGRKARAALYRRRRHED